MELHSERVKKMWNYTRHEWRRCGITLETSGEDVELHSKRVGKCSGLSSEVSSDLEESRKSAGTDSERGAMEINGTLFSTRLECSLHLLHSFRV